MSALRLRFDDFESNPRLEIRVDDETPQSDDPISIAMLTPRGSAIAYVKHTYTSAHLTIEQAEKVRDALTQAIEDAKGWK